MQGRKTPIKIVLTEEEIAKLNVLTRSFKTPVGLLKRVKIVMMISEGNSLSHISRVLEVQRKIVRKWGKRFMEKRLKGLEDEQRSGRPPVFPPEVAVHLIKMACELPDKYGRSLCLWDCKELARQLISDGVVDNISSETVRCILKSHKLKP